MALLESRADLTTEDKMRAWARGGKENYKAAGPNKLNDFAETSLRLARQDIAYAKEHIKHVMDICSVLDQKGYSNDANYYRQRVYTYMNQSVDLDKFYADAHAAFTDAYKVYKANIVNLVTQERQLNLNLDDGRRPVSKGELVVEKFYNYIETVANDASEYRQLYNNFYSNIKAANGQNVLTIWSKPFTAEEFGARTFYLMYNQIHFALAQQLIIDGANSGTKTHASGAYFQIPHPDNTSNPTAFTSWVGVAFRKDQIPEFSHLAIDPIVKITASSMINQDFTTVSDRDAREVLMKAKIYVEWEYTIRGAKPKLANKFIDLTLEDYLDFVLQTIESGIN